MIPPESPRSARERFTASGQRANPQSARKLQHIENPSQIGIGHTAGNSRQAGEYNAHPHTDTERRVAVVQNGIIENYRELRLN